LRSGALDFGSTSFLLPTDRRPRYSSPLGCCLRHLPPVYISSISHAEPSHRLNIVIPSNKRLTHTYEAHRAPPSTRTCARWQPYNSLQSARSSCHNDRFRNTVPPPFLIPHATRELQPRDVDYTRYPSHALRCLSISQGDLSITHTSAHVTSRELFTQHSTRFPHDATVIHHASAQVVICGDTVLSVLLATGCNLVPIKGFVHEVLRRSRTSRSVIQTALCWKSRKSFGTRRERGRDGAELRETQVALYHLN